MAVKPDLRFPCRDQVFQCLVVGREGNHPASSCLERRRFYPKNKAWAVSCWLETVFYLEINIMTLTELLSKSAARHNHLCPRQVLGARIGLAGAAALDLET